MRRRRPAHDEPLLALGRAVRELRARSGLSQESLGTRADMHRNYVARSSAARRTSGSSICSGWSLRSTFRSPSSRRCGAASSAPACSPRRPTTPSAVRGPLILSQGLLALEPISPMPRRCRRGPRSPRPPRQKRSPNPHRTRPHPGAGSRRRRPRAVRCRPDRAGAAGSRGAGACAPRSWARCRGGRAAERSRLVSGVGDGWIVGSRTFGSIPRCLCLMRGVNARLALALQERQRRPAHTSSANFRRTTGKRPFVWAGA